MQLRWKQSNIELIRKVSAAKNDSTDFASALMRPKVEASCQLARLMAGIAEIGAFGVAHDIVEGFTGTRTVPEYIDYRENFNL